MQMYTQHAHNLCARTPFFADHEFLSETYESLEGDYDDVVERFLGLGGETPELSLDIIMSGVAAKLQGKPTIGVKENSMFFATLLGMEAELCKLIEAKILEGATEGTKQLLGEICNKSESRQYKEKQRIKR